jgi:hypothetical protein
MRSRRVRRPEADAVEPPARRASLGDDAAGPARSPEEVSGDAMMSTRAVAKASRRFRRWPTRRVASNAQVEQSESDGCQDAETTAKCRPVGESPAKT